MVKGTVSPERTTRRDGVLLVNIGSPDSPTFRGVYRYLSQFLADRRVVDLPRWLWLPLLRCVILPSRSVRSARAYRGIWQPGGAPLVAGMRSLADALSHRLDELPVVAGSRYGNPSLGMALDVLRRRGVTDLTVLPLYPQYCRSTTGTMVDALASALDTGRAFDSVRIVSSYHEHPTYIAALAQSVRRRWQASSPSHLVLSFHGLPVKYIRQGDPYEAQVEATAEALAAALGLDRNEWTLTYQSRFPLGRWLGPDTDDVVAAIARRGAERVTVITPGFPVECLETLKDIGESATRAFVGAGGRTLDYIPALGTDDLHVELLAQLVGNIAGIATRRLTVIEGRSMV